MFFNKGFASFHLCRVEGVDFGDLGGKVWAKFNGMVIRVMGGELVMSFLREDISKVIAPFLYNWFDRLSGLGNQGGNSGFVDLFPF